MGKAINRTRLCLVAEDGGEFREHIHRGSPEMYQGRRKAQTSSERKCRGDDVGGDEAGISCRLWQVGAIAAARVTFLSTTTRGGIFGIYCCDAMLRFNRVLVVETYRY